MARLNITLRPEEARLLEEAVRATWERPAQFARVALLERAERILEDRAAGEPASTSR